MFAYRDFVPRILPVPPRAPPTYETFDVAVAAANSWIVAESIKVVTVETVVLPEIDSYAQGTEVGRAGIGLFGGAWCQFVRVWYEK